MEQDLKHITYHLLLFCVIIRGHINMAVRSRTKPSLKDAMK